MTSLPDERFLVYSNMYGGVSLWIWTLIAPRMKSYISACQLSTASLLCPRASGIVAIAEIKGRYDIFDQIGLHEKCLIASSWNNEFWLFVNTLKVSSNNITVGQLLTPKTMPHWSIVVVSIDGWLQMWPGILEEDTILVSLHFVLMPRSLGVRGGVSRRCEV